MKVTHQKHVAELAESRSQSKCDCRYKVMEAKAEVETHVAAGEKLKSEREKYKSLFHQYAKERKCAMDRLQVIQTAIIFSSVIPSVSRRRVKESPSVLVMKGITRIGRKINEVDSASIHPA